MSRQVISKQYALLATNWPKDPIRPEVQFQKVLNARVGKTPVEDTARSGLLDQVLGSQRRSRADEAAEVAALDNLLNNHYLNLNPTPDKIIAPKSDPDYYTRLQEQLKETPNRSWFSNLTRRLTGMVRMQ